MTQIQKIRGVKRAYRFFSEQDSKIVSSIGSCEWSTPKQGRPGAWVKRAPSKLALCAYGLHGCADMTRAFSERQGSVLGRVEVRGSWVTDGRKFAASEMRIVRIYEREYLVALAALAAAMVLHNFESAYPNDDRARKAIEAALARVTDPCAYAANAAANAANAANAVYAAYAANAAAYAANAANAAAYAAAKYNRLADRLLSLPKDRLVWYVERLLKRGAA